jgi:hypothetical protein
VHIGDEVDAPSCHLGVPIVDLVMPLAVRLTVPYTETV